jgi:hypothetical protein
MHVRYADSQGRMRELLVQDGAQGSLLIVDRDAATLCDRRLVAHLGAEEPPENAALVCRLYLAAPRRCRPLTDDDLMAVPGQTTVSEHLADRARTPARQPAGADPGIASAPDAGPLRCEGRLYRLTPIAQPGSSAPRLRWCSAPKHGRPWTPLPLREVVARFESYEPMRSLTIQALARHQGRRTVATGVLKRELERLDGSSVVLNRGLREAVVRAVGEQGLTMSEIALRCGHLKRDRQGRLSGQTSWLARRVGLMPESDGRLARWIRSDVLALIARRGLGLAPREVELG